MSKTMKNIPKLRFPEFRDAPEWEENSINNLVDKNILCKPLDGNHGNIHPKSSDFVKIGIPFVMANDIKNGQINLENSHKITKKQADSLQKGFSYMDDVLLTHKGSIGQTAIVPKLDTEYIMLTPQVTYYRVKDRNKFSNKFLLHVFQSSNFQKMLDSFSGGGTRAYVGITEQRNLKINYPLLLEEQQKIAECLSSLDALILAQSTKVKALKVHKKALMQQLFPSEGETTPHLRFSEFQNAPAWEEKKLYELNIYISDGNYGEMYPKSEEMKSSGIPFIRANNIKEQKLVWDDMKYIDAGLHDKLTSGHLKKDDILVTTRGEIGTVAYVTNEFEGANINAQICLLRCDESLNSFFIMQYLASNNGSRQFRELETGSALKQLPKKNLGKVKVSISPLLGEQQKIADCLSSVDELISSQSSKVEALKQHKKALMQQLFPQSEDK